MQTSTPAIVQLFESLATLFPTSGKSFFSFKRKVFQFVAVWSVGCYLAGCKGGLKSESERGRAFSPEPRTPSFFRTPRGWRGGGKPGSLFSRRRATSPQPATARGGDGGGFAAPTAQPAPRQRQAPSEVKGAPFSGATLNESRGRSRRSGY